MKTNKEVIKFNIERKGTRVAYLFPYLKLKALYSAS